MLIGVNKLTLLVSYEANFRHQTCFGGSAAFGESALFDSFIAMMPLENPDELHASQIKGIMEHDKRGKEEKQGKHSLRIAQRERQKDGWTQENVCNLIRSDVELCEENNEDVLCYSK